jgi:hypothetical protein
MVILMEMGVVCLVVLVGEEGEEVPGFMRMIFNWLMIPSILICIYPFSNFLSRRVTPPLYLDIFFEGVGCYVWRTFCRVKITDDSGLDTPKKRQIEEVDDGNVKRARYSSLGTDDEIQQNVRQDHQQTRLPSSDLGNDTGPPPPHPSSLPPRSLVPSDVSYVLLPIPHITNSKLRFRRHTIRSIYPPPRPSPPTKPLPPPTKTKATTHSNNRRFQNSFRRRYPLMDPKLPSTSEKEETSQ